MPEPAQHRAEGVGTPPPPTHTHPRCLLFMCSRRSDHLKKHLQRHQKKKLKFGAVSNMDDRVRPVLGIKQAPTLPVPSALPHPEPQERSGKNSFGAGFVASVGDANTTSPLTHQSKSSTQQHKDAMSTKKGRSPKRTRAHADPS